MSDDEKGKSGEGKATTSGTTFQEDFAAYLCTLVLAQGDAHPIAGLEPTVLLTDVFSEGPRPVDDLAARTSAGGRLFAQAKKTISLSGRDDSELAKVIDQFVRQFIAGDLVAGAPRAIDLAHDRLVLAVGPEASGTVADTLRGVLNAVRNASGPAQLTEIETGFNADQTDALQTVRGHLRRLWAAQKGQAITGAEELALLRLMHVVQLDFRPDGAETNRSRDLLRRLVMDPSKAEDAWNALTAISREFGPERKGGDIVFLRSELQRRGIEMASVPSYRDDIEKLKTYTTRRLAHLRPHSAMTLGGHPLKIVRGATADLAVFARDGDVAVCGEPGAGKSGVLHDACVALSGTGADLVVLTADDLNATSRESLAADLGISAGRSLADVLANWAGPAKGYLVVDALDVAARAGMSLRVLCALIREVHERAPRWRVIASMREYDLRTSAPVQELFRGTPHATRRDTRFLQVRHLHVDRLGADELGQLDGTRVALVVASASPKLREVLTNPFNLALLCSLLDSAVTDGELSRVEAQVGLLDLYWRYRVETTDVTNRESVLAAGVNLMVEGRVMYASRLDVARRAAGAGGSLDDLLHEGVLVELAPGSGSARLGFAHNILFDYAAARLWAEAIEDALIGTLATPGQQGLLLSMRPSLVMAFERLWLAAADRVQFWNRALALQRHAGVRLVGKIIAAGVAAEHFRVVSDVEALLQQLGDDRSPGAALLHSFVTAALTQHTVFVGDGSPDWMGLAARLVAHSEVAGWDIKRLLWPLTRPGTVPNPGQAAHANAAARALIAYGLSDPRRYGLVRTGLEVAAQTIAVDPAATTGVLSKVLEPAEFKAEGHEWLHPLAERLSVIASSDPEFALRVVVMAFSSSASRDEQVPLGGRILAISLNKHDMLAMGRHDISEVLPAILRRDPVTGTRIVIRALEAVVATEHAHLDEPKNRYSTAFRGGTATFKPDGSYIWAAGEHNRHEDWWKLLHAFGSVVAEWATEGREADFDAVLDVLRDESQLCVVWNQLLVAATQSPQALGPKVAELLASTFVLGQVDMRSWAGDLLKASYPYLDRAARVAIESAIRRIPEDMGDEKKDTAERRRNQMLGCLPADLIVDDELRRIREELDRAGELPPNDRDFSMSVTSGDVDEHWWLRRQGMSPENPANTTLLALKKQVEAVPVSSAEKPLSSDAVATHVATVTGLEQGMATAAGADAPLVEDCRAQIIDACQRLASADGLLGDAEATRFIRARLLAGSTAERPLPNPEEDGCWEKEGAGWSSPAPRVDAAIGLMRLGCQPATVDDEILSALERLSRDPVPAVRYQVLANAHVLARSAPGLMWQLIETGAAKEPYAGILARFAHNALLRLPHDAEGRLARTARVLNRRARGMPVGAQVRRAVANHYALSAVHRKAKGAERYLRVIASNPCKHDEEANRLIDLCRSFMRFDDPSASAEENRRVREGAFGFLSALAASLRRHIDAVRAKYAPGSSTPLSEADVSQLRSAYQLAHSAATELYFASGAYDAEQAAENKPSRQVPPSEAQKRRFFGESQQFLRRMCELDVVEAAYDVVKTLQFFVDVEPRQTLLLLATLLRRVAADGIQYESLAADLVVEIVETYLSEHAPMLRADAEAQTALLDVLDVFVAVGWPSATRLTYRLEEVFR